MLAQSQNKGFYREAQKRGLGAMRYDKELSEDLMDITTRTGFYLALEMALHMAEKSVSQSLR